MNNDLTWALALPVCISLSLIAFLICHRRLGPRATVNLGLLLVGATCLTAVVNPWNGPLAAYGLSAFIAFCGIFVTTIPVRLALDLSAVVQRLRPGVVNCGILIFTLLLLLGGAELLARSFLRDDMVSRNQPIITVLVKGTEDYRTYHRIGDPYHVPDPDLGWIPCTAKPFNKQQMRGPVIEVPKPKDVIRVLCYGDSNTEGADDCRSWPEELHAALNVGSSDSRRYEVANAGVAGYSSHQGLRRFLKDVDQYKPDIVFVSFGWNDFAKTGESDKTYRPPSAAASATKRVLFQYRFFVALLDFLSAPTEGKIPTVEQSNVPKLARVSIPDYCDNLRGFVEAAKDRDIRLILLTRPHQNQDVCAEDFQKAWLEEAGRYNIEAVKFAIGHGVEHVDVESFFSTRQQAFRDACHFTSAGNREMAGLLRDRLLTDSSLVAMSDQSPAEQFGSDNLPLAHSVVTAAVGKN